MSEIAASKLPAPKDNPPGTGCTVMGRPRNPEVASRALETALDIYGRLGWSGFTFGKVANQARIGKSSLYLRWPTKEDLLIAAFDQANAFYHIGDEDRKDLPFLERMLLTVRHRLASYFTPSGLAVLRLNVENQADPETMGEVWTRSIGHAVLRTRQVLREGIENGDLRPDASVVHLGDTLEGGMMMHALATPAHLREKTAGSVNEYSSELVMRTLGPWLTE